MPKRTSKKAAEYQARADEALANRKALVGAIGVAEEKYELQQDAVAEAQRLLNERAVEVADAYQNALDGGWTAAELKSLGITRPEVRPSKSGRSAATRPADNGHHPAAADSSNHDGIGQRAAAATSN